MSFEEFYEKATQYLLTNLLYLRKGQAFQNTLISVRKDLHEKTRRNGTDVFSNDAKFPQYISFLRKNW